MKSVRLSSTRTTGPPGSLTSGSARYAVRSGERRGRRRRGGGGENCGAIRNGESVLRIPVQAIAETPDRGDENRFGGVDLNPTPEPFDMDVQSFRVALVIDEVRVDGEVVAMPLREFELLELFLRHPGRVLTRSQILEARLRRAPALRRARSSR